MPVLIVRARGSWLLLTSVLLQNYYSFDICRIKSADMNKWTSERVQGMNRLQHYYRPTTISQWIYSNRNIYWQEIENSKRWRFRRTRRCCCVAGNGRYLFFWRCSFTAVIRWQQSLLHDLYYEINNDKLMYLFKSNQLVDTINNLIQLYNN